MSARMIEEHVATLERQVLATADAYDLYARFGYESLSDPARWMFRRGPT